MEAIRIDFRSTTMGDAEIVRRVLAGEKALFEILLRRYNQRLYRIIRGYLNEETDIQDAMQNSYLKAFDNLDQFRGAAQFSTWLIRIAINEALLFLNSRKKQKLISLDADNSLKQTDSRREQQINPERIMIREEASGIFEKAISELPEKYRSVFMMREVEGLSYDEISEALNITQSNLKVRVHRAKALLKENLLKRSVTSDLFQFGNKRCDAIVDFIMSRI